MGGRRNDRQPHDRRTIKVTGEDNSSDHSQSEHEDNIDNNTETDRSRDSVSIYDQNRNLNLEDNQEKDPELLVEPLISDRHHQQQQQRQLTYNNNNNNNTSDNAANHDHQTINHQASDRLASLPDRKQDASPIQSLTSSDDSSACARCSTTTDTDTTTTTTTCSTHRMSQTSSLVMLNGSRQDCNEQHNQRAQEVNSAKRELTSERLLQIGETGSQSHNHHHNHHHHNHHHRQDQVSNGIGGESLNERSLNQRITFSTPQDADEDETSSYALVDNGANHIKRNNSYIMIRMIDDQLRDDEADNDEVAFRHRLTNGSEQEVSLVKQFGRRMSAIPQLLGGSRRKSKVSHSDLISQNRRLSMQENFPYLPESPPTAVAGVGGTITTVTRSKRKTAPLPRLVAKNGTVNLFLDNIDRSQYVRDLFTTMIDIKWRYNLMAAAFGFVFSWLFFACIWYVVLYVHNDLAHENDTNWSPCIVNVHSFSAALLFSIETQSTLGFGSRIISVECPGAIVIFCIQLIFGVVVECLIVGMVFAKLSRPAKRSQTIMYSKYATVCVREGQMCLTFRVGDVRSKSHIIGATIRASLVSQKITEEGETIPFYHHQLDVKIDDSKNNLLLIWPVTIVHLIDDSSPFYRLNAEQLANFKFEIITVLEGTVESTGQSIQVRSSYLPSEVKWGYRFEPIVSTHGCGRYAQTIIDYNKFNRIVEVDTPDCCAMEYYSRKSKHSLEPKL